MILYQRTYFSHVFGALSLKSSITMRPAGSVPMLTSRNTRGCGSTGAIIQLDRMHTMFRGCACLVTKVMVGWSFDLRAANVGLTIASARQEKVPEVPEKDSTASAFALQTRNTVHIPPCRAHTMQTNRGIRRISTSGRYVQPSPHGT